MDIFESEMMMAGRAREIHDDFRIVLWATFWREFLRRAQTKAETRFSIEEKF